MSRSGEREIIGGHISTPALKREKAASFSVGWRLEVELKTTNNLEAEEVVAHPKISENSIQFLFLKLVKSNTECQQSLRIFWEGKISVRNSSK